MDGKLLITSCIATGLSQQGSNGTLALQRRVSHSGILPYLTQNVQQLLTLRTNILLFIGKNIKQVFVSRIILIIMCIGTF